MNEKFFHQLTRRLPLRKALVNPTLVFVELKTWSFSKICWFYPQEGIFYCCDFVKSTLVWTFLVTETSIYFTITQFSRKFVYFHIIMSPKEYKSRYSMSLIIWSIPAAFPLYYSLFHLFYTRWIYTYVPIAGGISASFSVLIILINA